MQDRAQYAAACLMQNKKFFEEHPKTLIQYKKQAGQKVGVMVAFKEGEAVKLGFSKCNISRESFNRDIGLHRAIKTAVPLGEFDGTKVPSSMIRDVNGMYQRAKRYFRVNHETSYCTSPA